MGYTINKHHGSYNIFSRSKSAVKYIVVHYVGAGTSAVGNALANCKYFAGGNRNASAHYFIDDGSIYEYADPATTGTWHVGDGKGKYGITNTNSIGIEVCNNGGAFTTAEIDRLTWLVQKLMGEYGVPASRVVRHYDASRKSCPLYYVQNPSAWTALHAQITAGKATGSSTGSTGSTTTGSDLGDLAYTGSKMIKLWQSQLDCSQDGKISNQSTYNRTKVLLRVESSVFDGTADGSGKSTMVVKLQAFLKTRGYDPNGIDGQMGQGCVKALQSYLKAKGYYTDSVDGYYGANTSTAVGKALKAGAFK